MLSRLDIPASLPRRAGASLVDLFIALGPALVTYLSLRLIISGYNPDDVKAIYDNQGNLTSSQLAQIQVDVWAFVAAVVVMIFCAALIVGLTMSRSGFRNGQTFGKQLFRIRAVRVDAAPWTFMAAIQRESIKKPILLYLPLLGAPFILPAFISIADIFSPLFDKPRRRALHDRWAKSRVWYAGSIKDQHVN